MNLMGMLARRSKDIFFIIWVLPSQLQDKGTHELYLKINL